MALAQTVTGDGPEDLVARAECPGHGAGDLGDADTPPVRYRHLRHLQALSQRLDLHLTGPAEVGVLHPEALVRAPADGLEGLQIRVTVAVEQVNQPAGEPVA